MGLNGFVKIHRKLIEWGWYSDHVVKDVFLHLLMTANFKGGSYMGYDLKPGQAIIGRKALAETLGFSEQQIRTALKKLESTGEIYLKTTNKFTVATIANWEEYQINESDINQQITNNQPTINQQITNNQPHLKKDKKDKNDKNDKNKRDKREPTTFKKPDAQDVKAYCIEKGLNVDAERFIDYYEANGWLVGKNHMKDWRATLRNWDRRDKGSKTESMSERLERIRGESENDR